MFPRLDLHCSMQIIHNNLSQRQIRTNSRWSRSWSVRGVKYWSPFWSITRRVLVLQRWYSHIRECVAVKCCRYHAIRGSVVCICDTYHTSTDGVVHYIWYCCTRMIPKYARFLWFLVGPRTSSTNENECIRVACHISSRPYSHYLQVWCQIP